MDIYFLEYRKLAIQPTLDFQTRAASCARSAVESRSDSLHNNVGAVARGKHSFETRWVKGRVRLGYIHRRHFQPELLMQSASELCLRLVGQEALCNGCAIVQFNSSISPDALPRATDHDLGQEVITN